MSKTARYIAESAEINPQTIGRIPVDDAAEALRFCRALADQFGAEGSDERFSTQLRSAAQSDPPPELSVVLPLYNEAENLAALYERLIAVLEKENLDFEIVFVDDGSDDETPEKLSELEAADARVRVVGLARNFGHQVAITAGLDFARGKAVAVMDGDLQDPPEALPDFIRKLREGYDVVYAVRERRKEGWLKRTSYAAFYRLLRHVSNIDIPLDAGDFCVMDRRVVDLLKSMPERNRFVRGIRSWVGMRQTGVAVERQARRAGTSKYTVGRLTILALDGLISFSYVPLRLITFLGLCVSVLAIGLAIFFFVKKLLYGLDPPGFATLTVSIFFLAGIQLVTLGVIGEYVGRIFEEAKRRPLYVLRRAGRAS